MFNTAVLFLIFNRPDTTKAVFDQIRIVKPAKLFLAADGPREGNIEEAKRCELTRHIVLNNIDWPCETYTMFRDHNLGCGPALEQAITWFFKHEEQGIILEDDCLPDQSFFSFCEELLHTYRDNDKVMHIGGSNFQNGLLRGKASYYFSAYSHIWGWATWRRAWQKYDFRMPDFDLRESSIVLKSYQFKNDEIQYWNNIFSKIPLEFTPNTWDYQWMYAVLKSRGVSILPQKNLVKNIGFEGLTTHVFGDTKLFAKETEDIAYIIHPDKIEIDNSADRFTFDHYYLKKEDLWRRLKDRLLLMPIIKRVYQLKMQVLHKK